jgi:GT2 family glycosyltransferase
LEDACVDLAVACGILCAQSSAGCRYEKGFACFAAENQGFDLKMVTEVKQGLSNARNAGITASKGEYVAIVDDDETLESSYIESYIEFFDSFPTAMAAGGAVKACYEGTRPRWMSRFTEQMIANPIDLDIAVTLFPEHRVPAGGNMAFRREVFDRVGVFNPQLGRNGQSLVGGEENDLFARLRRAGELLYFVPNAAIYHYIPDSKLTDDYFDRLSYNVGLSKRMRAEADGTVEQLLRAEQKRQFATYILAALYTIALQPLKAKYLLRMRRGIYNGTKMLKL